MFNIKDRGLGCRLSKKCLGTLFFCSLIQINAQVSRNIQQDSITNQLQEVEILGRKEKGYQNTRSFSGTKSAVKLKNLPQSLGYVTKELILDQALFRLNDVVKNISGANQHSFYNDFVIRGYRVAGQRNNGFLLNGMRMMTSFWKQQLIPHIERVEIIKGPVSALFGNASPGGTINSVTKKPLLERKESISLSAGSFNTFRILADFTGPINNNEKLLYRLNIGYEDTDGFRDLQFNKSLVVAPSFSFLPNDNTRVNFDFVLQQTKGRLDRGQAVFGDGDLYSVPTTRSLSAMNDYLNEIKRKFPHYYLLNAALYYNVNKFQVQVNLDNLLNRTYWVGGYDYLRAFPGAPRSIMSTVSYRF